MVGRAICAMLYFSVASFIIISNDSLFFPPSENANEIRYLDFY